MHAPRRNAVERLLGIEPVFNPYSACMCEIRSTRPPGTVDDDDDDDDSATLGPWTS
jgi:hypothetical protein